MCAPLKHLAELKIFNNNMRTNPCEHVLNNLCINTCEYMYTINTHSYYVQIFVNNQI